MRARRTAICGPTRCAVAAAPDGHLRAGRLWMWVCRMIWIDLTISFLPSDGRQAATVPTPECMFEEYRVCAGRAGRIEGPTVSAQKWDHLGEKVFGPVEWDDVQSGYRALRRVAQADSRGLPEDVVADPARSGRRRARDPVRREQCATAGALRAHRSRAIAREAARRAAGLGGNPYAAIAEYRSGSAEGSG